MPDLLLKTGSVDWSAGVDSLKVPTVTSLQNPNGLSPNQLAWASNATMREGALSPRDGWQKKGNINGGLGSIVIPGAPGQTIPQPPTPPVQWSGTQTFRYPNSNFNVPAVGAQITVPTTNSENPYYVGNVGDVLQAQYQNGPFDPVETLAIFIVVSFTSTTLTLQTQPNSPNAGQTVNVGFGGGNGVINYNLVTLGPAAPQPPIIIPGTGDTVVPPISLWQGEIQPLYSPNGPDSFSSQGTPYGICVIGGRVVAYDPDFNQPPLDLSSKFGLFLSSTAPRAFFCQAEQYLIIQAGDYNPVTNTGTLPLFWDGFTLSQSNGITGILARGTPQPATFQITTTQAWNIPATGTTSALIPLASAYPGNLGDNLVITTLSNNAVGTFRVTTITIGGIYLTAIAATAALQAVGVLVCTYTGAGNNATPYTAPSGVQLSNGFWNVPAAGKQGAIYLTSLYFGSVGDTITIQSLNQAITYGSFTVVSFSSSFEMVLQTVSSNYAGKVVNEGNLLITITACRVFGFMESVHTQYPFVIQPPGGTATLQWVGDSGGGFSLLGMIEVFAVADAGDLILPGFGLAIATGLVASGVIKLYTPQSKAGTPYAGHLYDIVEVYSQDGSIDYGTFRVVAPPPGYPPFFEQIGLQTIQSNYVGVNVFTGGIPILKVVIPTSNPQVMTLTSGQWTIPPVGQSVSLQIIWNGALGPAYPGNVGDNITLTNITPSTVFGTFLVTAFDGLGNITLQTVSTSIANTTIVGPTNANLTINSVPSTTGTAINQIPAATFMVYYQGIVWYAQGDIISGGDIVGGSSGTSANNYVDSVLCVTENPLAFGGDGFKLPIPGSITGMAWPAQIDASLGQGLLIIGTINGLCSLQVPSSRIAWIGMGPNNLPQIQVVQFNNGWVNDLSIVSVNGDLYFQSLEPGIRSWIQATRYFGEWGNVNIAANEQRAFKFVNRNLLAFASGIYWNNRLLQSTLPMQTANGVIHQGIIPLDFMPISCLEEQLPPNWEGILEGLQVFQLCSGFFNGVQRAFAITLNSNPNTPNEIDLWELVQNSHFDIAPPGIASEQAAIVAGRVSGVSVATPITWQAEFPAFTAGKEFDLKKLVGAQIWVDSIRGEVVFKMEYRPDSATCWTLWHEWKVCSAQNSAENVHNPIPYPVTPFPPSFRQVMALPKPQLKAQPETKRPTTQGYQFQPRLTIIGSCRLRGLVLLMEKMDDQPYDQLV